MLGKSCKCREHPEKYLENPENVGNIMNMLGKS